MTENPSLSIEANDLAPVAGVCAAVPSERRLLSKAQVAARLGCSERSLERLVKQERFPTPRRYGRAVVWFESAVEHVLALAEQEQLQWRPVAEVIEVRTSKTMVSAEAPVSSPIPEAHELEPVVQTAPLRKPRKAAGEQRRRFPEGLQPSELKALGQVLGI